MWFIRPEMLFHSQIDLMLILPFSFSTASLHQHDILGPAARLIRRLIKLHVNILVLWGQISFLN